ncbi:LysE family transporter [Alphaproteobacteria bacterium GH1-50]|uniref:LysE family transporter n=1 Tax=Kangsaoukella pontilimi TaxID=2691042 RepID=A0A7C9MY39_9RHOB|nr:LysE family translocator [Kangsaoukella pontilimi]MXQ09580.1 LysE family transporter [Kangsaoukella pontilimi]
MNAMLRRCAALRNWERNGFKRCQVTCFHEAACLMNFIEKDAPEMALDAWLLFSLAILVASISPGPNVLVVIVNSARHGLRGAFWTIFGNLTCLFGVALLASVGVGAMIATAPTAYAVMKLAGGLYLAWLGFKILRNSFGPMQELKMDQRTSEGRNVAKSTLFLEAVAISASNPKSILFLSAVFPQFLDTSNPVAPQFCVMFATIIAIVTVIHGGYAFLAVSLSQRPVSVALRRWLARLTGTTFIGLGAGVAFSR